MIDQTQNDFSRIANFFISIGVINTVTCLLYVTMFQIIKRMDHEGYAIWILFRGLNYISVLGYIVLFFIYRHKLKNRNNALSLSMINIWGTLLIGGEAFRIFFSAVNFGKQDVYFYQKTLMFLFPVIGCLVLGFVIQDKLIQWAAFLIVILYMLLSGMGIEIKVGSMLGNNVNVGIGSILTGIIVSAGMILLGIHLKRKGER